MDFSKIEGLDAELVETLNANEVLKAAIASEIELATNNRVEVAKGEFKRKMDAMDSKVKAAQELAQSFEGVDPAELETLRAARDNSAELSATLDKLKESYNTKEQELAKYQEQVKDMQHSQLVNQAINDYNTENKDAYGINPDAIDLIAMLAKESIKLDENGKPKVYTASGDVMATNEGAATPKDWIASLREQKPSLFKLPAGSGATGSKASSGDKTISRSEFAALPPDKQPEIAKTHTITE